MAQYDAYRNKVKKRIKSNKLVNTSTEGKYNTLSQEEVKNTSHAHKQKREEMINYITMSYLNQYVMLNTQ